jgi:hypothetical protein
MVNECSRLLKGCNQECRGNEEIIEQDDRKLKGTAPTPLPNGCKPELVITDCLNDECISVYQQFIGILRWSCEIGRVDILLET